MTHSIPVPPGNQSPYPLQEPPHVHHAALAASKQTASGGGSDAHHASRGGLAVIGGALALGALAIAAVVLGRGEAPAKRGKRRTA